MEEIRKEREYIRELLDEATEDIREAAFDRLKGEGYCDPIVIALYLDGRKEFLYPRYKSAEQRNEAFEKVDQFIVDTDATAMVFAMEMTFQPKGETKELDTVFIGRKALGVSEYEAHVLEYAHEGIVIKEKIGPGTMTLDGLFGSFSRGV